MAALEKRSITIGTAALVSVVVALVSIAVTYGATTQRSADQVATNTTKLGEHQQVLERHSGEIARLDKEVDRAKDAQANTNRRLDELLEEVRGTRADLQRAVWKVK